MATLSVPAAVVARIADRLESELRPALEGQEARVFLADGQVVKIYGPHEKHLPRLEARNLARAGLGGWVAGRLDEDELGGYAALILKRFPGRPFAPERFGSSALASLAGFLLSLHRLPEAGETSERTARERIAIFRRSLAGIPAALAALERLEPLAGLSGGVPHRFTHLDLWAGNVLISDSGRVLVVDWSRAGGDDPARDLAILTTGSLSLLGWEECLEALRRIVRRYPEPAALWRRLGFWIPLTFLHDLHWFKTKQPGGLNAALSDKLPRLERSLNSFPSSPW
ncbi:phosphotransferase family protein [Oceanithermus sp.]